MNKIFFLCFIFILNLECGLISRKTNKNSLQKKNDLQENRIPMRSWIVTRYQIFPMIVEVARTSLPRSKIHENSQKYRLHFWYLNSEEGDVLTIIDVINQDSISTLNLYKPIYLVSQPLFIKDPIPLKHFFKNSGHRIQALGISEVSMRIDIK